MWGGYPRRSKPHLIVSESITADLITLPDTVSALLFSSSLNAMRIEYLDLIHFYHWLPSEIDEISEEDRKDIHSNLVKEMKEAAKKGTPGL